MPDTGVAKSPSPAPAVTSPAPEGFSSEEEEMAFQRAVEMMLSGEGLDALGMGGGKAPAKPAGPSKPRAAAGASFDETIRKTMESLNAGGAGAAANADMPGDLAALLKQLGEDPSALDGLGDDDDELGGLLDGMMAQLMSKEVLEEPMTELAAKVCTCLLERH
jgi:peroxin-19